MRSRRPKAPAAQLAPAGRPPGTGPVELRRDSVFCREGEYWTIAYEGTVVRLRDTKGLHCLAHLLRHPGKRFAARDLLAAAEPSDPPSREAVKPRTPDAGAEHARIVVTKRVKAAIKKVAAQHPALGYYLTTCIKTGYVCAYVAGPDGSIRWRV